MPELENIRYMKEAPMKLMVVNMESSCPHWHYEYEIFFVLKGQLSVHKEDGMFKVKKGDIIFFNSKEIHSISCASDSSLVLILQFSPDLIKEVYSSSFKFFINTVCRDSPLKEKTARLQNLLADMYLLSQQKPDGYQFLLKSKMYYLLSVLFNDFKYSSVSEVESEADKEMLGDFESIQKYVSSHFDRDIKEEALCRDVGMSRSKVYSVLKAADVHSFRDFVNYYRVEFAKKELLNTKEALGYIAVQSGFESESSFYRVFKSLTGQSPANYRLTSHGEEKMSSLLQGYLPYSPLEASSLLKKYIK